MIASRTNHQAMDPQAPPSTSSAAEEGASAEAPASDPLAPLILLLEQLRAEFRPYAATWADQARLLVQFGIIRAVTGLVLLLLGATCLITAAALFLIGAATGLGHLLGERLWLGQILVGAFVPTAAAAALYTWRFQQNSAAWRDMIRKYEHGTEPAAHE
jgi:hypothetical protein